MVLYTYISQFEQIPIGYCEVQKPGLTTCSGEDMRTAHSRAGRGNAADSHICHVCTADKLTALTTRRIKSRAYRSAILLLLCCISVGN